MRTLKRLKVYVLAIWNIGQIVNCLDIVGYVLEKDNLESQGREREICSELLNKIGSWRTKNWMG